MRRAFLSLYLVIVCAVLAFSWATERIWQAYVYGDEELDISIEKKQFIQLLIQVADGNTLDEVQSSLSSYLEPFSYTVNTFHIDELASSELKTKLSKGMIVPVSQGLSSISFYVLMGSNSFVIELIQPQKTDHRSVVDLVFIIAFYSMIALAVYFWIWPLSRDLKVLRDKTKTLTNPNDDEGIQLNRRSAVYDLALAFNSMRNKIRSLVSSQKEMTHAMSHELRTPLARMKFAIASLDDELGEKDKRLLQLRENVSEMDKLISDFLNYASFEEGSGDIQFECGRLAPMVERVCLNLDLLDNVEIVDLLESSEVWCEWFLMEHCVRMILENAKRYFVSKIRIELSTLEQGYEISVEDDGPGVPLEERESIFKAFVKSTDTSPSEVGFGLGLALVSRMMSWHKGKVTCGASSLGGARFQLRWQYPPQDSKLS